MDAQIDIKRLREDMGLTQAQFAERLGLDRTSVSRMETGNQKPSGSTKILLRQLAEEKGEVGSSPRSGEAA
jgi:DNA-binding transcriptional regulator YiaG